VIDSQNNTSSHAASNANFADESDFVKQMMNAYTTELQRRGYDPAFAEYLVAQDAHEST
jgi:hypothetical protein